MKNMKRNLTFMSLLAVLVMTIGFASALGDINTVEFNGVDLNSTTNMSVAVSPGEVVPVWVQFTASGDASDVTIEVEIKGRNGVSVSRELSDIEAGTTYPVLLSLELPETDDLSEVFTLYVTVASNTKEVVETFDVQIKVQRESFTLDILSVDYSSQVEAGDIIPVSVVAKNVGYNRADDNYVVVSIPALGVSTRGYAGDLVPVEDYAEYDSGSEEDSVFKTVYLKIPSDALSGVYEVKVAVYNDDTETVVTKLISVEGEEASDSDVIPLDGEDDSEVSTSIVALTVVLVIIFVVLLAVLVVLLTKKEKPIDEVETSYY